MLAVIPFFGPVKFTIPVLDFELHGFGFMVALGLFLGSEMAMQEARRDGLDPDIINRVVTWMIVGIFVGGHLGFAFMYEPERIAEEGLIYLLKFWDGLSSFGGFFMTSLLCMLFFYKENQRVRKANVLRKEQGEKLLFPVRILHYGDCVIFGFPMAFGFGRIGCFMAHDHPGIESDFPLAVAGICESAWGNVAKSCHDLGLYEAIWACSLIPIVHLIDKSKARFPGFFLALIPFYYGPVRFFLDGLRTHDRRISGFTPGQYGAMVLFFVGLAVFLKQRNQTPVRVLTEKSDAVAY